MEAEKLFEEFLLMLHKQGKRRGRWALENGFTPAQMSCVLKHGAAIMQKMEAAVCDYSKK